MFFQTPIQSKTVWLIWFSHFVESSGILCVLFVVNYWRNDDWNRCALDYDWKNRPPPSSRGMIADAFITHICCQIGKIMELRDSKRKTSGSFSYKINQKHQARWNTEDLKGCFVLLSVVFVQSTLLWSNTVLGKFIQKIHYVGFGLEEKNRFDLN